MFEKDGRGKEDWERGKRRRGREEDRRWKRIEEERIGRIAERKMERREEKRRGRLRGMEEEKSIR